jgi:hypothetical protein
MQQSSHCQTKTKPHSVKYAKIGGPPSTAMKIIHDSLQQLSCCTEERQFTANGFVQGRQFVIDDALFGPNDFVTVRSYFRSFRLTPPCSGCAIEHLVAVLFSNAHDEFVARGRVLFLGL